MGYGAQNCCETRRKATFLTADLRSRIRNVMRAVHAPSSGSPSGSSVASRVTSIPAAGVRSLCHRRLCDTWASWHAQNGTPLHVLQELGRAGDGEALRAPCYRSSRRLCRPGGNDGHKFVTATFELKTDVTVSPRKTRMRMVAKGGIEPSTRGFSIRRSTN